MLDMTDTMDAMDMIEREFVGSIASNKALYSRLFTTLLNIQLTPPYHL